MDKVLSKSNKTQIKQAKIFIRVFGTHFISEAQFGASMVYEKQYNSRSQTQAQKNSREQCTGAEAKHSVSVGFKLFGMGQSVSTDSNNKVGQCTEDRSSRKNGNSNGNENRKTLTIGTVLPVEGQWGRQNNFFSVPIK